MTMELITPMYWPGAILPASNSRNPANQSYALASAGVKRALAFQVPKTGNIRKISFRTGTVTSNGDCDVRLETLDSSTGKPTGTLVGTNTNKTVTLNAASTVFTVTLTADAAVTQGQFVAVVWVNSSGNYNIQGLDGVMYAYSNFPTNLSYNGSTWSVVTTSLPFLDLEYDDGSRAYIVGTVPASTHNNYTSFNTGSTPDERAMGIILPQTSLVHGCWVYAQGTGDFDMLLYDTDGTTQLAIASFNHNYLGQTASGGRIDLIFSADATLIMGRSYYLAFRPSTSTNVTLYYLDAMSSSFLAAMPFGSAVDFSRTDGGAWSINSATRQPLMGLIITGVDSGIGKHKLVGAA